jgi:hypothetical protein
MKAGGRTHPCHSQRRGRAGNKARPKKDREKERLVWCEKKKSQGRPAVHRSAVAKLKRANSDEPDDLQGAG